MLSPQRPSQRQLSTLQVQSTRTALERMMSPLPFSHTAGGSQVGPEEETSCAAQMRTEPEQSQKKGGQKQRRCKKDFKKSVEKELIWLKQMFGACFMWTDFIYIDIEKNYLCSHGNGLTFKQMGHFLF